MVHDERLADPGRQGHLGERSETGLFRYNRLDISFQEMQSMARVEGDMFAVFLTDIGETRVQYAKFSDYSKVAYEEVLKGRLEELGRDQPDLGVLQMVVCMLMLSRLHNYQLENFVHLLDHRGRQVIDSFGLLSWIAANDELFSSPSQDILDEDDIEALEREAASA